MAEKIIEKEKKEIRHFTGEEDPFKKTWLDYIPQFWRCTVIAWENWEELKKEHPSVIKEVDKAGWYIYGVQELPEKLPEEIEKEVPKSMESGDEAIRTFICFTKKYIVAESCIAVIEENIGILRHTIKVWRR